MSKTKLTILSSVLLSTVLVIPAVAGSPQHSPGGHGWLPHYVLYDVGSFGGGNSALCGFGCRSLNKSSAAVGIDATSVADPYCPNWCFFDGHVAHAFEWKYGGTNDLGSLHDGVSSVAESINAKGLVAGVSQDGKTDAGTGAPEARAVLWSHGRIRDLGTLGGTQSATGAGVNGSGQVSIESSTSNSNDPYINVPQANCIWLPTTTYGCSGLDFGTNALFLPVTTQTHGGVWSKGLGLQDSGTLGGPDSMIIDINDSGLAAGWSYVSFDAGQSGVPDTHAIVWDSVHGVMQDLGTLGGTFSSAMLINQAGQVTGAANLQGDAQVHPFLWDPQSKTMQDLGTFGGTIGHPNGMNDQGDVVGVARDSNDVRLAFYWHNGQLNNLGVIGSDPASEADNVNSKGMIVGEDFEPGASDLRGWVSDRGGPITDLNTLIRNPHDLYVVVANYINDRGVIAAQALTHNGDEHAVMLVPEDDAGMIAQMNAAMGNAPRADDASPASTPSRNAHRPQTCVPGRRQLPHFCTSG